MTRERPRAADIIAAHLNKLRRDAVADDQPNWQRRHIRAWRAGAEGPKPGEIGFHSRQTNVDQLNRHLTLFEQALVLMISGIAGYIDAYQKDPQLGPDEHFVIGADGVIGPAVQDIIKGIHALLNGERGRLDGGALDGLLRELALAAGLGGILD